jgi:hypoxia-inducible factor 1 alpha
METEAKVDEEEADSKDFKMNLLNDLVEQEKFALQSLDGFLLILSGDGDVTYVSENISEFLGLSKVSSVYFSSVLELNF